VAELAIEVQYRDALPADAAVLTHHRFDTATGCDAERAAYSEWVRRRVEGGAYIGRLALVGGVVISGAGVVLLDWGPTRGNVGGLVGRVVAVFTEPEWRRRGVAGELLRQVMACAAAQGVRDFRLAASTDGAGLYTAIGFKPYGAEMVFKGLPA
jgi:GNAT superfamily N-acetyltransferase